MHSYLQRVQAAIDDAIRGLTLEQLAWRPKGKWSAAAILEHLSLTYSGTAKGLQRCLDAGRPRITPPNAGQRLASFVVTGLRYMPPGREAPAMVLPKGAPPETVLDDVRRNLAAADEAISRCEAGFGSRAKIANHPILGPLTARQWRTFHLVHARHHMKQIMRIRAQIAAETKAAAAHG
ncbi:MAG TPA: DUF1569 domain-containing protein [Terriglobales bacterium]|nr:DUF1569 domain-containing protein [Terriglobales bacterium]